MASHFEAIGFDFADEAEFAQLVERAAGEGKRRTRKDGGVSALWRDESGASVAVHLDIDAALVCAAPSFAATSRVSARINGVAADPECPFCSVLVAEVLENGEVIYPLVVQLENIDEVLESDVGGREAELALAAFAVEIQVWPDERTYEEAVDQDVPLASQSLIPTGLFTPEPKRRGLLRRKKAAGPPQPHALVTGVVETAATLRNAASGLEFIHARVATYGPVVDVLASAGDVTTPVTPGNVVQSNSWLIGRLLGQTPEVAG
jgi:hypothetical protein